jgi:prepilin-type N-terminal cleavage/methylation domain-containing protein
MALRMCDEHGRTNMEWSAVVAAGRRKSAFTLIELLLVVAIIALLISILLPALASARNTARVAVCSSNMRQQGIASSTYAAESKDRIAALNWKQRFLNGDTALSQTGNDGILLIQGKQAKDIADRRYKRILPQVQNRYFNRNYWHLVLIDGGYYGGFDMIQPSVTCPADQVAINWRLNADNPGVLGAFPETSAFPNGAYEQYRPFWSTYQLAPVAFSVDRRQSTSIFPAFAYPQFHHIFENAGFPIGQRAYAEVTFPSQKVHMFDPFDRHSFKRPIWHAYDRSAQPLVFFDTSVRFKKNKDCELGWQPNNPGLPNAAIDPRNGRRVYQWTNYLYNPGQGLQGYDYPTLSGNATDSVKGYFRWTAEGLKGYDFR